MEKLPIYARAGVQYAWLLHPIYRSLEVFRLRTDELVSVATHVGNQRVRAEPFDAIELDLARIWRDVPPPPPRGRGRASDGDGKPRWSFADDYDVR
jgi:Uma2 family endonuclease